MKIRNKEIDIITRMNEKVNFASEILETTYAAFDKGITLPQPFYYETRMVLACDVSPIPDAYAPFWYHPDHLGSSSYITNLAGEINQHMEYLPFGELLVEEHLNSYNSPFKFNAKEFDAETGNYYYGARYYDPKWSLFISTDPAFELYPSFSSYAYTLQNPVKYIDPTGMFVEDYDDDYFNKQGKYLGSDNAKTDKVRIIEQDVWDRNKIIDEQGRESINHNIGYENSSAFSESNLTIEEELKVYQHYNPTDLTLEADTESRHGGATFIARLFNDGSTSENININIKGNKRNSKIADDANAIINVFEHERYHYDIYKKEGFSKYLETPKNVRERRAVMAQMKHPSFSKTSINFQRSIINYGKRHGLQMTVNELVPVKIKGL